MKFKKFVSGLLACAMVVTSVFTGNVTTAKAEGPAARTVTPEDAVGTYNFDGTLGDGVVLQTKGLNPYSGDAVYGQGKTDFVDDKAVRTGTYGMKLPHTNLGTTYTVSAWLKAESSIPENTAMLFVGYHNPEKWVGLAGCKGDAQKAKVWTREGYKTIAEPYFNQGEWKMITLAQSGADLDVYINGKLVNSDTAQEAMNGADQSIWLGTNNWDASFNGYFDDVNVYNKELSAIQVYASYLDQMPFKNFGALAEGDSEDCISKNLNLPETYDGMALTWTSNNPDKIGNDGEVKVADGSDVLLTASGTLEGGVTWSHDYKVRLAKSITVEYMKKGETTPLKTKEVAYRVADSYTYTPTDEDKVWTHTDGKTYVLSEEEGDNTLTTSGDTPKFTLTYNEDVVTEIVTEVPDMVTRIGVRPALPETVTAKFSSGAERENVKVDWSSVTEDDYATVTTTPRELVGKVGAVELKIKLTVKDKADYVIADYTFDKGSDGLKDAVPGSEKFGTKNGEVTIEKGLKGNAAYFPGGAKNVGYVQLPDNLLKVGENEADERNITVSMFCKTNTQQNSFAVSLLTKGTKNDAGIYNNGTDYLGFINHKDLRAEFRTGSETKGAATGTPAVQNQWYHYAIVVDSDAHTMSLYKNGVLQNTVTNEGIDISSLSGGQNYLGYTTWPDNDFAGAIDEFKVYNATLTQGEIQSICDDTLFEEQMNKAKDAIKDLKTTSGDAVDVNDVADDLELPTGGMAYETTIEWTSDNNDVIDVTSQPGKGAVTPPTDEDATVTLKAKIIVKGYEDRAEEITYTLKVLKNDGINKRPLLRAINAAKELLEDAKERGIYSKDSLQALEDAINAAQEKYDSAEITEEEVVEEAEKLKAAQTVELKDLDELQEDLSAWYKFDKDTSDSSRRHADAEKVGEVTFTKENGATFKGENAALKNMIKMPVDKLKVTDRMTFSMQVNAKAARNFFGIGTVVGDNSGASKHLYMNSSFVAFMSDNGWNAHTGFNLGQGPFALNAWHNVTVVLDGKTITLYLDGVKKGTEATETTMTAAWNYENGTKYAYLGNCAYAHNGNGGNDPDFNGSIKDVRIYNVALDEEQVGYIDAYRAQLPMDNAKEDLIAHVMDKIDAYALLQEDGSYKVNVSQDALGEENKIDLPATIGAAAVTWESSDSTTINAESKVVTLPAQGAEAKEVTLTAKLTIGEKTEEITFVCNVFSIDTSIDREPLKALLDEAKEKVETDYTAGSWTAFWTAYEEAVAEYAKPTDAETLAAKKTALETAMAGLVDVTALRSLIEAIEVELSDLVEETYTSASWDDLTGKLAAAKTVLGTADATAANITAAIATLPSLEGEDTVESKLKKCGSKEELNAVIETAEELAAYKDEYTAETWSALETALATAKEEQAKRLESYDAAAAALQAKIDALEVKPEFILSGDKKTEMQGKLDAAKAEAEERVEANYTPASWETYQKAITALERILAQDKATIAAANDALAALEEATAALTPVSAQEPNSAVKKSLADAIAGANTNQTHYTADSWAGYKAALDKLNALKAALDEADSEEKTTNITRYEIEKAIEALGTAAGQLVPNEAHAVGEAEKDAMAAAIAEAGTFRKAHYTDESWAAFQEKLNDLKAMQNSTSVTKEEVQAATKALEDAMNGLVPTDAQKPDADKVSELKTEYDNATAASADLKEADYTAESWAAYQNAYAALKKVADRLADDAKKGSVTKTEIQTALDNFKAAALVRNVDKTALNAAITGCTNLNASDYTAATWSAFQASLNAAKAVAAKDGATQAEVDAALADLNAKKAALARSVVTNSVLVNNIKLSATYKNVAAGKKTTVKAVVNSNATDKGITFASSNAKWATVNAKTGVVTTKKAGAGKTVTITATANDAGKKKQTIKIKIMKNAVTKVTVKKKSLKVKAGKKVTIKATVKTNGKKANKTLSFTSSNTKWATVTNKGKVTTKKAGKGKTVKITITSTDGTNKKAVVKIKLTK